MRYTAPLLLIGIACSARRPPPGEPTPAALAPRGDVQDLSACDLTGAWQIRFAQDLRVEAPFSEDARIVLSPDQSLCIEHPGSPVNARLSATLDGASVQVRWWSQAISDGLGQVQQVSSLVPERSTAPAAPPPSCDLPLPPTGLSDRPIAAHLDAWGYRCEATSCQLLRCALLQGPSDSIVGTFELIRR